nr:hypothetical protein CFP56_50160 [Quercus suber]
MLLLSELPWLSPLGSSSDHRHHQRWSKNLAENKLLFSFLSASAAAAPPQRRRDIPQGRTVRLCSVNEYVLDLFDRMR